ncbi:unnamed protein product (macronuclear) [Paramecium tetraurelia]|uniref:Mitochondrial import inner membrane translocase subunit TIM16 n=1 Tax=Paramecium tetraurelia TaxID=5888 RepID=A0DNI0_PARTE|nr:uncharacterized protein GSPATT00018793001 [Paramecium tetraurelia]CAK84597.1 unnamed protein product [Paramecium tetraurelia]|eukprot:XP_001451994.1 hypothetical protein (macronuclear) [Paramecium tetraurelia strain d4-2]
MVKRLIIKFIIEVGSTVAKSFMKAYQQSAKQQGGKSANPFSEFLNQTMQAANLTHKPMTRDEAFKILQLTAEKTNAEEILKIYWRQFHKNDPVKGGSFYIQSMVHNAKCELMKDFPDANEKEILEKLRKEEESQKGKEEEVKQEEQKEN